MCDAKLRRSKWSSLASAALPISCLAIWSCGGDSSGSPSGPEPSVSSVTVTPSTVSLPLLGDTVRLEAVARDASGSALSGKVFTWSSSLDNVATVSSNGLVTALATGGATISASTAGVAGSASVTVQTSMTGSLRLITTTVGRNLDLDGYTLVLDGSDIGPIGLDDTVTVSDLETGPHSVALSGLSATCHEFAREPISKSVVAGHTTDIPLGVECLGIPDDIYLVFSTGRQDPPGLNLAGLASGETVPVTLTFHPAFERAADWSPDGTRLAFNRGGVIHVVDADGTDLRSFEVGTNPAWSPDGSRIAYDNESNIVVFDPDGAGGGTLVRKGVQPAWSPDGSKIAYEVTVGPTDSESDIFVMNADGSGPVNLTQQITLVDREPTWSPDGSRIAFRRLDRTESVGYDLWVMDADGSNQTRLVSISGAQTGPRWLPDNRILFTSNSRIMALDLGAGGTVTQLTFPEPGEFHFDAAWRSVP